MTNSSNKQIAKNTIFMYFRMLVTMLVSLYTSRIVLKTLGIHDYGIYQTVGGIIEMLSFISGALASGSSRYLTFALGQGNRKKLEIAFCTTLNIHILLSLIIVLIAETAGLCFLYNYVSFPLERMNIVKWVYQISILASVITITQIPYTASIISHEKMNIYAYMSIFEVTLKLFIVYLLTISNIDKLLLYSILLFSINFFIAIIYRIYCLRNFEETHFKFIYDKSIMKEIASFSGWSLFSSTSTMLANQGIIILLNNFFSPAIVTARALSLQVNNIVSQFVSNFRTAVNPQIIKSYAVNNLERSEFLVLILTQLSFYMILLLGMPLLTNIDFILNIWLEEIPPYATIFVQLILVQTFIQTIDSSLYYGLYACAKIKQNAIVSPVIAFLGFPICYIFLKNGASPVIVSWVYIGIFIIIGFVAKPYLLIKYAMYDKKQILSLFKRCFTISIFALFSYYIVTELVIKDNHDFFSFIISSLIIEVILLFSIASIATSSWSF